MTHKYLTLLFFDDNAKSVAKILSLNLSYTVLLLNILITGLCDSSDGCSLKLIPDLILFSYQKTHRPYLHAL